MIAGSIFVFGSCGIRTGAGMKRGTIGLFGPNSIKLLPTFRQAGRFRPLFLRLLFRELARLGFPVDPGLLDTELLALPWRSGRPGKGRDLDASERMNPVASVVAVCENGLRIDSIRASESTRGWLIGPGVLSRRLSARATRS